MFKRANLRFIRVLCANLVGFSLSAILYYVTHNPEHMAVGAVIAPLLSAAGKYIRDNYSTDIIF